MKKQLLILVTLLFVALGSWAQCTPTQFTDFTSFTTGTVNYQGPGCTTVTGLGYTIPNPYGSLWTVADEWGFTGPFDQGVKDDGTGNKVWRISNAIISGSYSFQPNSPSSSLPAGETTAALYNDRGPNHTTPISPPNPRATAGSKFFKGGFKFKSATGAAQAGLFISINPIPRQTSYRMSYVGIQDVGTGFNLVFYETTPGGNFPSTTIASNLSYTDWHQVDIYIEFVDGLNLDGSGNDIVTVKLNGTTIKTGTTWESYYAENPSSFPSPIAIDALMFRSAGTAAPGTSGNGLYFDDVTYDNSTIPVSVFTSGDYKYTLSGGNATIIEYIGAGGDIIIPSTLDGHPVTGIGNPDPGVSVFNPAFFYPSTITSITIPNSVTTIGAYAFFSCYNMSSVNIPSGITSIAEGTFFDCMALTSITIPASVTSIGVQAFQTCTGLTSVTIPGTVTNIGNWAFSDCYGLTSVTISNGVTSIGAGAFFQLFGLTTITIPASVTSIGGTAFYSTPLTKAYFLGNAPTMGGDVFYNAAPSFKVSYICSKTGFTTPTWLPEAYPTETTYGVGVWRSGSLIAEYCTIQAAINSSTTLAGDVIEVAAGSYNEDLTINKSVTLHGAGYNSTTVIGPIGGTSATMQVGAPNVVIDGFKITRDGNNSTDWNNAGLNSAGIAVQGLTNFAEIKNNKITGMRTAIDINSSNGNNIHNNIIDDNRTGFIFRNQTDNTNCVNNEITNNWTVGVLFLDASGGTNIPVQSAINSTFNNNKISGNWYGQIVDRQVGGSLPAPGTTNMKNFNCNWYGTSTPIYSVANSTEPGYAAQIPAHFPGGTATAPGGQPDVLGLAAANFNYIPYSISDGGACIGGYPVLLVRAGVVISGHATIQAGIDAAIAGDIVKVYPGNYNETAPNSSFNGGIYQFGLFFSASKSDITVQGCKTDGTPVTSTADIAAFITTNATNTFGYAGTLVAGNNITISGLEFGSNTPADDKAIEVVGNGFAINACRLTANAPIYIGDYNYNENLTPGDFSDDISSIQSYTISNCHFAGATSIGGVYIANGAGWTGTNTSSVTGRSITGCTFDGMTTLGFAGLSPGAGWLLYPTGAATATGNTFTNAANGRYIQSWGVVQAQFPYASYFNDNTFPKKVITTTDGNANNVRGYDASSMFLNLKRIGTVIQSRITNALPGDVILVGAGTYDEYNINIDKALTLKGANADIPLGSRGPESKIQDLTGSGAALINTLSDGITINGFELTTTGANNAIYCGNDGPGNLNIKFNNIHDIGTARGSGNVYAINYRVNNPSPSNVNISDNIFNEIFNATSAALGHSAAIWVGQSTANGTVSNLTIERNTISNVKTGLSNKEASGIYIGVAWGVGTGKVQSPVIRYNSITDIKGGIAYAIQLSGKTPGAIVSNNTINNIINLTTPSTAAVGVAIPSTNTGSATINVNNNSITNVLYAIINGTTNNVEATLNWYGSADGPYNLLSNPCGTVGQVSNNLTFIPWFADALMTTLGYPTPAPTGPVTQSFCSAQGKIVSDLTATLTGTDIKWYSAASGGTLYNGTELLVTGSYFASQTVGSCESIDRLEVAVTLTTLVPTISGPATPCKLSTGNSYTTETGMTGYDWTISAGGTITAGGDGFDYVTVTWGNPGTESVTVNYIDGNGCAAITATNKPITVLGPTITGPATVCKGDPGQTYTTESGKASYTWLYSGAIKTAGGNGFNYVTLTWTSSGARNVKVTYTDGACTSQTTYPVTVNKNMPALLGDIYPCLNTITHHTTDAGQTGYDWTISAGGSITGGGDGFDYVDVLWNTAGAQTVTVIYTAINGCTMTPTVASITVAALPVPTLSGPSSVCANSTGNVYTTEAGMLDYTWYVSPGGTKTLGGGTGDNSVTITWNTTGPQTVSVGYTRPFVHPIPECSSATPTVKNVLVNAPIAVSFAAIGPYCQNDVPTALPGTSIEGIAGSWNPAVVSTAYPVTSVYTFTPNYDQCALPGTLSITVNPLITPTFNPLGAYTQGVIAPPLPLVSRNNIAGTWNPAVVNTTIPGIFPYVFTPTNTPCAVTKTVNIQILPAVPVLTFLNDIGTTLMAAWPAVADAGLYNFSYRPSPTASWINLGAISPYVKVTNLIPGTNYECMVKAYRSNGQYISSATTYGTFTPEATVYSTYKDMGTTCMMGWNDYAPWASSYVLQYKKGTDSWKIATAYLPETQMINLTAETTYDVRVLVYKSGVLWGTTYAGTVTTGKVAFTVSNNTGTTLDLSYAGTPDFTPWANTYGLSYKEQGLTSWINLVAVTTPMNHMTGLTINKTYDCKVVIYVGGLLWGISQQGTFSTSLVKSAVSDNLNSVTVYPNPFLDQVNMELFAEKETKVIFDIYDVIGNVMFSGNKTISSGYHTLRIDASGLSKGVYILRALMNDQMQSFRIIKQ